VYDDLAEIMADINQQATFVSPTGEAVTISCAAGELSITDQGSRAGMMEGDAIDIVIRKPDLSFAVKVGGKVTYKARKMVVSSVRETDGDLSQTITLEPFAKSR
jgi:hypothetical protein